MNVMSYIGRSATLTVLSGVNSGAEELIEHRFVSIGGGEEDDLVLDDLPPGAVTMRHVSGGIEMKAGAVSATAGDVTVEPGRTERFALPARVAIGDVVTVYLVETPGTGLAASFGTLTRNRKVMWAGLGAAAALAVALLILQLPSGPGEVETAAAGAAATESAAAEPACEDCVTEAAAALRGALSDTALAGLEVTEDAGAIRVSGAMPDNLQPLWSRIRMDYDRRWAARVPIVAAIVPAPAEQPIVVSAVWLGETPEVIAADNTRYRIGDVTVDGWSVEAIDPKSIVLTRDGIRLVLGY